MVFVRYGNQFGIKAYRLYDPHYHKFQIAHSKYFDDFALIRPQQGDPIVPLLNPPMVPHRSMPATSPQVK